MPNNHRVLYWDSCVFLSYIHNIPERAPTIEMILDETAENDGNKIITSSMSIVEVAYTSGDCVEERLDPTALIKIDEF